MANPRLPLAEKQRRGTVKRSRERTRPAASSGPRTGPPTSRDYTAVALAYVADVLSGAVVAGQWTVKACRRFEAMRRRASDPACPYLWSPDHVQHVCAWISQLPHVEGRWGSSTIELQPWQVFILAATYGFRKPDGARLVSSVFFEVGRKSAKSTLVAACALYHLGVEDEPGASVVCAATTGNQSRIVFSVMARMVKRASWLRDRGFTAYANAITFGETGGTAKPINSKSSTQDGLSPSFISLDESHAQDFTLFDVLRSAQGARADAMLMAPTTAGYDLTSVGYALRSTAMKILDGVVEADHAFVVLYELDEADDWRDERVWVKALPMLGVTPTLDYVRKYRDDALATPGLQGEFETKQCNRWLHSAKSWLSVAAWDKCADRTLTLDQFAGERVYVGVDCAERDDVTAVAVVAKRGDTLFVFIRGYLPGDVVRERSRAVPEYLAWTASGELQTTDGNFTDYPLVERDLRGLCDRFDVGQIVIERYGALAMASNLVTDGLPAVIESKNAKIFTAPALELEGRIRAGKLRHCGSSFLRWQISNVCVERRRDGSLLPTKESAESKNKVDAVDAILLALSAMLREPSPRPSVYESRGVLVI